MKRIKRFPLKTRCPSCNRFGRQMRNGKNRSGTQRVKCFLCGRIYTLMPKPRGYSDKLGAVRLVLWDRRSFRDVARDRKIDHKTIANWVRKYQQTGKID